MEKGCLLQADVLRGDEYITIEIALEHKTQKPDYFAFHVDPNARQDQGLLISFTKKGAIDSDGSSKLAISDCDPKSCVARVPLGFVKKSKDSRNLNLLDKFLKSDDVVLVYTMDGKEYRTALPLSSFKQEYQRLLSTDLK